jgi:hypothetical protein
MMGDLDHHGVQQDWRVSPGFNMEFARSTFLGFSHGETFERFNNINFRRKDTGIGGLARELIVEPRPHQVVGENRGWRGPRE